LANLQTIFTTLGSVSSIGNMIWGIVSSAVISQIMTLITKVCQTIVTDVKTLIQNGINRALGGICIPLPSLGLGIKLLKIQPTTAPPCGSNSLSLVQVLNMAQSAGMKNYNYSTMIPTGSGPTFAP
jgi:hypothetical protein